VIEDRLGLHGKDASIGALEELASMRLRQPRPVTGIGLEAAEVNKRVGLRAGA
jgi:hypothetical protein